MTVPPLQQSWVVLEQPDLIERLRQLNIPLDLFEQHWATPKTLGENVIALLEFNRGKIQLRPRNSELGGPLVVDFNDGKTGFRIQRFAHEAVVKAVQGRSQLPLSVIDATAGLGRDAMLLAAAGINVTAIERHPAIYVLLKDGCDRAQMFAATQDIIARLKIQFGSAQQLIPSLSEPLPPQVIYLDPMFPDSSRGTALVKKEMRIFRELMGKDNTTDGLLQVAMQCAEKRVVVKRPRKAPPLSTIKPSSQLLGKSNRFDVYAV